MVVFETPESTLPIIPAKAKGLFLSAMISSSLFKVISLPFSKVIFSLCKFSENKKAKHFPYAYKIDNNFKKSDDKEPKGSASDALMKAIADLNNSLIVVARYKGGGLLGKNNLTRCFHKCIFELIKK